MFDYLFIDNLCVKPPLIAPFLEGKNWLLIEKIFEFGVIGELF